MSTIDCYISPGYNPAEDRMPIEHTSTTASAYPAQRAWLLDAVVPPHPDAARNSGRELNEMCRAFIASLWDSALAEIPTQFERLVFLAKLRDPDAGYRHYGLELPLGMDAADVIRESHERTFRTWIALTVEQQKSDIELYLATAHGHRNGTLKQLTGTEFQQRLVPASADAHELALYRTDLDAVLQVLAAAQPGTATATLDLAGDEA